MGLGTPKPVLAPQLQGLMKDGLWATHGRLACEPHFPFLSFILTIAFTFYNFFFIVFLGPHPRHIEVPGLRVELELQLLAYTTATATLDPSRVCDLHHSSWQCERSGIEPTSSGIHFKWLKKNQE